MLQWFFSRRCESFDFFLKWITLKVCTEIEIKCGSRMRLHESLRRDGRPYLTLTLCDALETWVGTDFGVDLV